MSHEQYPAVLEMVDDFERDKPQEECGVYGIFAPGEPVARIAYDALHELQHRGQNGAGLALYDSEINGINVQRGMGLIDAAIPVAIPREDGTSTLDHMFRSPVAIGHTRYSTAGAAEASQPMFGHNLPVLGVAHNGHIEDIDAVADKFGVSTENVASDSALLTRLIDQVAYERDDLDEALDVILPELQGAFCLTITDGNRLIAVRDPWGFRPLSIGKLLSGTGYAVASESVAFDGQLVGFMRDVEEGEIVTIDSTGISSRQINRKAEPRHCMFEYIYTARPDSVVNGSRIYTARQKMGEFLATEERVDIRRKADIVVGVPSSGLAFAAGFAKASGLPLVEGIFKNAYAPRSFIMDGQERTTILKRKLRPNVAELAGQRIVLGDDSLIKGNTMTTLIALLKQTGVREVHVRVAASRYEHGCYQGMDTSDVSQLIARGLTDEEIAKRIGANSIRFNSLENIERAVRESREPDAITRPVGKLCMACTTGEYPFDSPTFVRLNAARKIVDLGTPLLPSSTR